MEEESLTIFSKIIHYSSPSKDSFQVTPLYYIYIYKNTYIRILAYSTNNIGKFQFLI